MQHRCFALSLIHIFGQPLPLLEAAFDYAGDEAMARAYAEGFACELHFERERSAIGFAAEWLERPLPLADPVTHREMLEPVSYTHLTSAR